MQFQYASNNKRSVNKQNLGKVEYCISKSNQDEIKYDISVYKIRLDIT